MEQLDAMTRFFFLSTLVCFAGALSAQTTCPNPHDSNNDGAVTISDLLDLLSLFGDTDTDLDGIWDNVDACVDTGACNYAADPTESCAYIDVLGICGGGCEGDGDGDGICDDVDTCVGDLDECGVCNGPGPTEIVIEDITILYDSVYLPQLGEWYVYEFGADTTFSYTCAPSILGCTDDRYVQFDPAANVDDGSCTELIGCEDGATLTYQGFEYSLVTIGEQCWFAENLRSENYENGDVIPAGLSNDQWQNTTSGAVAVYVESASNLETYGRLYNWYAVDDSRGLCPSGWHVPTDGEWTVMTDHLGGSSIAGGYMKTAYGWYNGGNGTNSSGFSGLPGGYRDLNGGAFSNAGFIGGWWSSSPGGSGAWYRSLSYFGEIVGRGYDGQRYGFSVRCVRDAE